MKTSVFVDNLPCDCTEEHLRTLFAAFGPVQVVVAKRQGQHLGFGFVVCYNATAAEQAIATLNGTKLLGRPIRVCATISPNPQAA